MKTKPRMLAPSHVKIIIGCDSAPFTVVLTMAQMRKFARWFLRKQRVRK